MPYQSRSPSVRGGRRARRRELAGTAIGLLTVAGVVAADLVTDGRLVPLTAVLLGPLLASALAGRSGAALVAGAAVGCAVLLVWREGLGGLEAWSRLLLVLLSGAAAVLTTHLRVRRESELAGAERVAELSTALQQGLLPSLSGTARVDVLARYRPRTEELVLGGDFIDVVPLDPARGRSGAGAVAFCVGDVTGHDPVAAGLGASLRAAWRTLALSGGDPAQWLRALDAFTRSEAPEDRLATVCVGVLDPQRRRLLVASAGHPRPVLLTGRAQVVQVEAGPPLGLPDGLHDGLPGGWTTESVVLDREMSVLLYTDGLVEGRRAPGSPHRYGEESLSAWLDGVAPAPRRVDAADLDHLLVDVESANGGPLSDDVAVVVLTSRPAPAPLPTAERRPRTVALP